MAKRSWLHSTLTGHAPLTALVGTRIASATKQTVTPPVKPFIIHRLLADRPDMSGDDVTQTSQVSYLIFIHDVPGSYDRIDQIEDILRALFHNKVDQAQGVIRVIWEESSEDFRDDDMGTIMRYCRIAIKIRE